MTGLNPSQILADLDYDWWQDQQQFIGGTYYQSAEIFWQDNIGNWHAFTSTGPCTANPDGSIDATTREWYVKDVLMAEAVRQIGNTGCSGGITNLAPKGFKTNEPIYFS